ncbi:colicin immunity domain-containing protein [Superficieibacter sp.]|uniref:colicin immunity domain-containing protein n=1 Tax=Superficieibacter sp. TaxID=2303322 RepID=UPI0028A9C434|nr:colicin immunity domain-containing protein [Superficieibacter sp.]
MCSKENETELLGLIEDFISGNIPAIEFEKKYIAAWRHYRDSDDFSKIDKNIQIYVDRVFTTLDVYCSDPELRDENDLDDNELFSEIIRLSNKWKKNNL